MDHSTNSKANCALKLLNGKQNAIKPSEMMPQNGQINYAQIRNQQIPLKLMKTYI